jgi:hypothetical protein
MEQIGISFFAKQERKTRTWLVPRGSEELKNLRRAGYWCQLLIFQLKTSCLLTIKLRNRKYKSRGKQHWRGSQIWTLPTLIRYIKDEFKTFDCQPNTTAEPFCNPDACTSRNMAHFGYSTLKKRKKNMVQLSKKLYFQTPVLVQVQKTLFLHGHNDNNDNNNSTKFFKTIVSRRLIRLV